MQTARPGPGLELNARPKAIPLICRSDLYQGCGAFYLPPLSKRKSLTEDN
jgi:hypothetical protein